MRLCVCAHEFSIDYSGPKIPKITHRPHRNLMRNGRTRVNYAFLQGTLARDRNNNGRPLAPLLKAIVSSVQPGVLSANMGPISQATTEATNSIVDT